MADDKLIKGIDRRPYVEVEGHESKSRQIAKGLAYLALGAIGLKGLSLGGNLSVKIDPTRLDYLHRGLSTPANPWWQVAGLGELDSSGKVPVRVKDFMLEGVKRSEEFIGGIPRTLGLFGTFSRSSFTSPATRFRISPEDLVGAEEHYRALIQGAGQEVHPLDMGRGFVVQPHQGRPALFRVDNTGLAHGDPVVKDVDVAVRRWFPEGAEERYRQYIREADIRTEFMGGTKIRRDNVAKGIVENAAPFSVTKAQGGPRIGGFTREALEPFMDVDWLQNKAAGMSDGTHRAIRDVHVLGKRMSERYMRILDQPLEFIQEIIYGGPRAEGGILAKAEKSSAYGFFRNVVGTGGNYSGSVVDMWARHAGRIAPLAIGAAAAYEVGSAATNLIFDKDLAQVGGAAVGAAHRTYASASDWTGLTALNKYQEEKASGSGRFLGVMAFPLSGFITGHMLASATQRAVTETGEMPWRAARVDAFQAPDWLKPARRIPGVGRMFEGAMTRGRTFGLAGMAIGGLASLPYLLGSLGSSQSYDEVTAEQAGETEVAVRKGRYWEMGRTDIQGERVEYYRPGWFRRLMDDPTEELKHADLGDRPFTQMLKSVTDPYWREEEFYHDRPYPITGPDTSGFGPLGTLWGATLGKVLKPAKFMHTDELSSGGMSGAQAGEVVRYGAATETLPDASLGGLGPEHVVSPYSTSFLAGEGAYKLTEAFGLPGFLFTAVKKKITGEQDFGTQEPVLATGADIGSIRDSFWDASIGGGFGTSEAFRRVFPNERFQLQKVNPVKNTMPSWMPGADHFTDFQHGDPYAAIAEGEYRLPGSGYEARYPELEGIDPEDYPDIHKYRILADVAPYSAEFKSVQESVQGRAEGGSLAPEEQAFYRATEEQLLERDRKVKFADDKGLIGGYWSTIKKLGRVNPAEQILPISPIHKFAGSIDAIGEYQSKQVYSKSSPSWGEPISDFVMPAIVGAARVFGYEGVPYYEQSRRDLTGYFDKLEYIKYKKLESKARAEDSGRAAFAFARKAEYTMYGADPYADVETVKRVLPRDERPYFEEFLATSDAEDKGRILELVPEYTRKFYTAQWQKQIYASLAAKGDLSSREEKMVSAIEASRALEGEASSKSTWGEYQSAVSAGDARENTFPDYIRAKELEGYFDDESPLDAPPTDWLGYNPGIAMDDVKLKVVQNLGHDFHDFDLWENDVARVRRMPYVEDAADDLLSQDAEDKQALIDSLIALQMDDLEVDIVQTGNNSTHISFEVGTDRTEQLKKQLEREGIRYGR